ncbi:MAG TPA: dihydroneopterin aldolase [Actinomycetota bacterium]|jgi:dihydroneopterin aldolase/2-amino-4-hydroxy-6-hydroxymethyldihydropteridine diphosphokinase|nr:dihydroneopterin aldolase [Actinomycetota bacterium]
MAEIVRITGIGADGRHGVLEWERDRAQSFVVDLEFEVDAAGDDLTTTADYARVVPAVQDLVAGESYRLIETLARRIAEVVVRIDGVRSCRATVHKPGAAETLGVADVSAEARSEG